MKNRIKTVPNRQQQQMILICIDDYIPQDHFARHLRNFIKRNIDLSSFYKSQSEEDKVAENKKTGGGYQYPVLEMLTMMIYSYLDNTFSSRKMEERCKTDFIYKYMMSDLQPDFSTIARFRSNNLEAFNNAFKQTVEYSIEKKYMTLEKLALDGTVIKSASGSRHNYSVEQLLKKITKIEDVIEMLQECIKEAEQSENTEELPNLKKEQLKMQTQLEELNNLKPSLEVAHDELIIESKKHGKKNVKGPYLNSKEPDSRIMKDKNGGYCNGTNCQIAVDEVNQLVADNENYCAGSDHSIAPDFLEHVVEFLGHGRVKDSKFLEDNGYFSLSNLIMADKYNLDLYVAPTASVKLKEFSKQVLVKGKNTRKIMHEMKLKMQKEESLNIYKSRISTVEPVFGKIKFNMKFTRFSMIGHDKKKGEFDLVCAAHNIKRLINLEISGKNKSCQWFGEDIRSSYYPVKENISVIIDFISINFNICLN